MVKTFEERQEELAKERDESHKKRGGESDEFDMVAEADIDADTIEEFADRLRRIALPAPDDLGPGERPRQRRRLELRIDLVQRLADELGISLADLQEQLQQEQQANLDLQDSTQLLQLIASFLQTQNQLLGVVANTSVTQLENLISIANDVRPATLVTVSGREIIDDADVPQPVIPDSDKTDIPTKTVFIRADPDNDNPIVIGDDEVDPNDGFILQPGEAQEVRIDFRDDQLFMAADEAGEAVRLLGLF